MAIEYKEISETWAEMKEINRLTAKEGGSLLQVQILETKGQMKIGKRVEDVSKFAFGFILKGQTKRMNYLNFEHLDEIEAMLKEARQYYETLKKL